MNRFKHRLVNLQLTVFMVAGLNLMSACTSTAVADTWPPAPLMEIAPDLEAGTLPSSISVEMIEPGRWRCTFRVRPSHPPDTLTLAGTMNGWNKAATPLSGPDEDRWWTCTLELPVGRYLYKFVANDNHWFPDPRNPDKEPDGHSGHNSVLRLGHLAHLERSGASRGDGTIEGRAIEHDPQRPRYYQPLPDRYIQVRVQTLAHDVEQAWLCIHYGDCVPMTPVVENELFTLWEGIVQIPELYANMSSSSGRKPEYMFLFEDGDVRRCYPVSYGVPVTTEAVFSTPDWAKHAIWYQIFPDRFRNGDPSNDPEHVIPWTMDWFSSAPHEGADGQTFYKHFVFWRHYGGDIAGIEQQLPYLKDLGVNAIYLNPVFEAWSNHKYDATDYLHIDDQFGKKGDYEAIAATEDLLDPSTWKWTESDKIFLRFLKRAHELGFKVIIDGVFNHVGQPHPAFQDVKQNKQNSRYADWFNVTSWEPFEFTGWGGFDALPEFKKTVDGLYSESLKQHIFNVTRRWMDPDGDGDPSDGIDGWRLDVPNEIPAPFWAEWRKVVKEVNPDAYITGEIWDRADHWLDGKHFDAVMNYEFAKGACKWVFNKNQKIKPSELDQAFRELRLAYPREATLVLQNLMNSHDTDRVASMAHNPDRAYDHANRIQDNGPEFDNTKPTDEEYARARLTTLLQMTYVGAPMIYYGDEVGMWGADDPTCRKPMLWKDLEPYEKPEQNHVMDAHRAYYQRAIKLRTEHPALRTGSFQTLLTDDAQDVWCFLRADADEQLLVVLNASNEERVVSITLPSDGPRSWQGVFNQEGWLAPDEDKLQLTVPAIDGVVLHAKASE